MALIAASPNTKFHPSSPIIHPILSPKQNSISSNPRVFSSISLNPMKQNMKTHFNSFTFTHLRSIKKRWVTVLASSGSAAAENYRKILLSDVAVKPKRRVYWGRKWNFHDIATASIVLAMHILCLFAPFAFNWPAFWVAVSLYIITGLFGITLSFHRNLSHRSFRLPKWLEYFFAYCGVQAAQGNPMDWVSTHRYHHQFVDSDRDPHSPIEGFWYSHTSWLFDTNSIVERCGEPNNVGDLQKQPFYRFLRRTYIVHPIALGVLLYGLGGFPFLVWGMKKGDIRWCLPFIPPIQSFLPFNWWATSYMRYGSEIVPIMLSNWCFFPMAVRIVWVYHITWLVNSACHVWGHQAWNTGDLSRNNWWVALLAFGEGWHNNHHAFEFSARHGLEWWQLDMTWYIVRLLQVIGLATDVKVPSEIQKERVSISNKNMTIQD